MSAHGTPALINVIEGSNGKIATFTMTGSASYDAGGSTVDLSRGTLGVSVGFTLVHNIVYGGVSAHASDVYRLAFVPAASYGTSPKLKVRDLGAAADAEASGDLSSHTFIITVYGR